MIKIRIFLLIEGIKCCYPRRNIFFWSPVSSDVRYPHRSSSNLNSHSIRPIQKKHSPPIQDFSISKAKQKVVNIILQLPVLAVLIPEQINIVAIGRKKKRPATYLKEIKAEAKEILDLYPKKCSIAEL